MTHRAVNRAAGPDLTAGCDSWEDAFADRLTGDEECARRKSLDSHLEQCAACRTELSELEAIATTLRQWGRATRHSGGLVYPTPDPRSGESGGAGFGS